MKRDCINCGGTGQMACGAVIDECPNCAGTGDPRCFRISNDEIACVPVNPVIVPAAEARAQILALAPGTIDRCQRLT